MYATKIQKWYRAYKQRRAIKILIKLPDDLRNKIITIERADHYYNKSCNVIAQIIGTKIDVITDRMRNAHVVLSNLMPVILESSHDLVKVFYLYDKYFSILYNNQSTIMNLRYLRDLLGIFIGPHIAGHDNRSFLRNRGDMLTAVDLAYLYDTVYPTIKKYWDAVQYKIQNKKSIRI